ncbi:MAG: tetratricopeptide repeat protein [Acidimicrobiia bacterium]
MSPHQLGNFPVELTSFIGRNTEIGAISSLVADHRLVSLVGPGGVGKTRLATRVAGAMSENYSDGTWFIDLSLTRDEDVVPSTVADPFDIGDLGSDRSRSLTEIMAEYFSTKGLLLILDNCEHVLEAVRAVISTLITRCPHLAVLATSRVALGMEGEIVYRVSPLGVRTESGAPGDAVRLFLDRLALVDAAHIPDQAEVELIEKIVAQLDGLPLAIELAASHAKLLSPGQILERLSERFRFLDARGGVTERHQTLRATMEWSYELLAPDEKVALHLLSVFNGWSLEAADTVLGPNAFDLLERLVDKSLVEVVSGRKVNRYRMLATVREYGQERLAETGKESEARTIHANFFLKVAERSDQALRTEHQVEWLGIVRADLENVRAALAWAMESNDGALALRLVTAMGRFWFMQTHWAEALQGYARATRLGKSDHPLLWARAFLSTGIIEMITQSPDDPTDAEAALRILEDEGTPGEVALATYALAEIRSSTSDAGDLIEESIRLAEAAGDRWIESYTKRWLGSKVELRGDPERNISYQREAVEGFTELGDMWSAAWLSFDLGYSLLALERYAEARAAFQGALDRVAGMDDRLIPPHAVRGLASVAAGLGRKEDARRLFRQSIPMYERIGDYSCLAFARMYLADVVSGEIVGDDDVPLLLAAAVDGFRRVNNEAGVAAALSRLARQASMVGETEMAARLLGASIHMIETHRVELSPHEAAQHSATVKQVDDLLVGSDQAKLVADGSGNNLELLISEAVEVLATPAVAPAPLPLMSPPPPDWPAEYRGMLEHIKSAWTVVGDIHVLRFLGGKSGAIVLAVDLSCEGHDGQGIIKLERGEWSDPAEQEASRHRQAWREAPDFAQQHLPRVVHTAQRSGETAILVTIAARGLEYTVPWAEASYPDQANSGTRLVRELLETWNSDYRLAGTLVSPSDLLASWLDYRIDPGRGRIHGFLVDRGVDPLTKTLMWGGHWYPNPLAFALEEGPGPDRLRIRPIYGNIHGDLHGHNVLIRGNDPSLPWFLIDLAFYRGDLPLFFDHAYLELSHLLDTRSTLHAIGWPDLLGALAGREKARSDDVGLIALLQALRSATWDWVEESEPDRVGGMESQLMLARVAVGLNFTHKRVDGEIKNRAFFYAMEAMKEYVKFHELDWPRDGVLLDLGH